jgi:hypothetical protein
MQGKVVAAPSLSSRLCGPNGTFLSPIGSAHNSAIFIGVLHIHNPTPYPLRPGPPCLLGRRLLPVTTRPIGGRQAICSGAEAGSTAINAPPTNTIREDFYHEEFCQISRSSRCHSRVGHLVRSRRPQCSAYIYALSPDAHTPYGAGGAERASRS